MMGSLRQRKLSARRYAFYVPVAACLCFAALSAGASKAKPKLDPWQSAVAARADFEAESPGAHTRVEYARVLEQFRAIYHGDPSDLHAPRAIAQVAELLAEQGHEFGDSKSLHDAARQYEFLAGQYPAASLAPEALRHALDLLGPDGANDSVESRKVRTLLETNYPKYARLVTVHETRAAVPVIRKEPVEVERSTPPQPPPAAVAEIPKSEVVTTPTPTPTRASVPVVKVPQGPPASITGIRHWSTSTYTRVVIDLGDEVQYEAARVENPDRIFFDLHHSKLEPQLAGKSFTITDDGFLTKIRAAQFSGDVTRVVLDVHEVTEYSAFLLPNPYRLIIDIHGKRKSSEQAKSSEQLTANSEQVKGGEQRTVNSEQVVGAQKADAAARPVAAVSSGEATVGPVVTKAPDHYVPHRVQPAAATDTAASSGLPPMPVTDGSALFGLPPKRTSPTANGSDVAPPRVVIPAKSTQAKPVPNTVTSHTADANVAVAAVSDQPGKVEATSKPTSQPIVGKGKTPKSTAHVVGAPVEAAPPTADGETSLVRALGLKIGRIVIDAGHGGHDSGTLGVDGIEEKDVVLDVALRLGKLLHDRLGAEVVYTRADDTFIPLETRTAIANKAQADLFISVHANSSPDADARGVEVYYLNFTSDPDAMRVASRENAVSTQSVHDLSDLVKRIALKDKIDESRELATDVEASLYKGLAKGNGDLKNRGVKKAPFVVLIGANMPSILAEISFVTNPRDADQLSKPEYRQRVAESLYGGVASYASGINGGSKSPVTTERAAVAGRQ